jgi:hypothetical protein
MRKVHARFHGVPGTFAQFGDSITYSRAFWSPLAAKPKNMSPVAAEAYQLVKTHLKPECLSQKGPSFGNQGSTTILWAQENVSDLLAKLNPEVAVILFGSNDVAKMEVKEYEEAVREVVAACLTNGTIVLLTTAPLQTSRMEKCLEFTGAIRKIASDTNVPLIDYCGEILKRRPNDWDGASAQFRETPEDTYEVPTLEVVDHCNRAVTEYLNLLLAHRFVAACGGARSLLEHVGVVGSGCRSGEMSPHLHALCAERCGAAGESGHLQGARAST